LDFVGAWVVGDIVGALYGFIPSSSFHTARELRRRLVGALIGALVGAT